MKKKKSFVVILISTLSVLLIATTILPQILSTDEGNGFIIKNLSNGSSIIKNNKDGYQFLVNNGWYSILLPATEQDIANFKIIAEQNNIPLNQVNQELASLPFEEQSGYVDLPLFLLDLDSNHYANGHTSGAGIVQPHILGVSFMPVAEILNRFKSDKNVKNVDQIEKNGQIIYIVDLNFESNIIKLAIFVRNNKMTGFFVGTDDPENHTDLSSFFDETINSLEFFDVK